jgi:hypothetical protein
METLLHYVWKHRLYDEQSLTTTDGAQFEVLDTGMLNRNAGPDFFNAKIRFGNKLWVGNVEIHNLASDWCRHRHDTDRVYNTVILHVAATVDVDKVCDSSGRIIPQWKMNVPEQITENYRFLLDNDRPVPCLSRIGEIPSIDLLDWKSALLTERLERKAADIYCLLDDKNCDWNEVLYIILARNFGFGVNNDAFELLARSLPLKIVLRHTSSPLQIEALFLGQAGLLEDDTVVDNYYGSLRNEYVFLKEKYKLKPLDCHLFRSLRIRPNNFPHVKIIQLAGLVGSSQGLFAKMLETDDINALRQFFSGAVSEYWKTHYHFGKTSHRSEKKMGLQTASLLLINVVAPMYYAYGQKKNDAAFIDRTFKILDATAPESNSIVKSFVSAGLLAENAADTQALIQLKREYCEKKKCIYCRIGRRLLASACVKASP